MSKPSSQGPKDETKVTLDAGPDEDTLFGNFTEPAPSAVDSPFTSTVDSSSAVTLALSSDVVPEEARGTAPIGEATRVFMTSAGLYKRRRNNRLAGAVASVVVVGISSLLLLDVTGLYTVPFMGAVYEVTGIQDPNIVRAVSRVEEQLAEGDIAPEERAVLQKKLMGLQEKAKKKGIAIVKPTPQEAPAAAPTQGVVEKPTLNNDERALMAGLFNDERKKEATIKLIDPTDIQVPNLPDGLTQEAIYKVVSDNTRSMQLCLEESFKKGDKPPSKMEVELTIAADGTVKGADVLNARSSAMGACTVKRVKNWRFPRFNGEPVTVVFPYVLSQSF